jgi:hypothetical protein
MLFFFNWLREVKGVERILKVIVEDHDGQPHTDEAIERSLKSFGVEVLDWSKPDLDPYTISNAAGGHLRELVLHWGGNNAVLRAWGDPEMRAKMSNLTQINLVVDGVSTDILTPAIQANAS